MAKISDIINNQLCLGCGLCSAISEKCEMRLNPHGFYEPLLTDINPQEEKLISNICPSINITCNREHNNTSVWGNVILASNAWAVDENIRKSSSSGGVTSALAIYLLESHRVDAILHVGVCENDYLRNTLHISKTKEDVLKRNASRYAPALVFDKIFEILDKNDETYAFIGKPCDIAGIKNLISAYPKYKNRIKYFLSIFCAGMPSYNASIKAINTFGNTSKPISLQYRGNGWPGYFTVKFEDGTTSKMTYNESWGNILGKELGLRCKICPDGIGLLADISSGDSWNTKDGYPDFAESDGRNFCFIRTKAGKELFESAIKDRYIIDEILNIDEVRNMQNYQYTRRHYVGWRIVAIQFLTRKILSFKNIGYIRMALRYNFLRGIRESLGTIKRFNKIRHKNG